MRDLNEGMDRKSVWRNSFFLLSLLFYGAGCAHVGFRFCDLLWKHRLGTAGNSTPLSAMMLLIPYGVFALLCVFGTLYLNRSMRRDSEARHSARADSTSESDGEKCHKE